MPSDASSLIAYKKLRQMRSRLEGANHFRHKNVLERTISSSDGENLHWTWKIVIAESDYAEIITHSNDMKTGRMGAV